MIYSSGDGSQGQKPEVSVPVLSLSAVNISMHFSSCMTAEGFVLQPEGAAVAHRASPRSLQAELEASPL